MTLDEALRKTGMWTEQGRVHPCPDCGETVICDWCSRKIKDFVRRRKERLGKRV